MIRDAKALDPTEVPDELVHRDNAIDALRGWFSPFPNALSSTNAFIFGPSGTGKTTVAKHVAGKLKASTFDIRLGYANCMRDPTTTATLATLIQNARLGSRNPAGTPRSHYLDLIEQCDDRLLLILDEVNVLPDFELLHTLWAYEDVNLICICVDEDNFFSSPTLNSQTRSRLRTFEKLHLQPYSHSELVDILQYRVRHGLDETRVAHGSLSHIAECADDTREAIMLLQKAARQAHCDGVDITPELVDANREAAHGDLTDRLVRSLGTHKRALYEIVRESGEIGVDDLAAEYKKHVQDPRADRTRRRYLELLEQINLIESDGQGRGKVFALATDEPLLRS